MIKTTGKILLAGTLLLGGTFTEVQAQRKTGGAAQRPAAKPAARPATSSQRPANVQKPATKPASTAQRPSTGTNQASKNKSIDNSGNRANVSNNRGGNNTNISGNNVNVDKSRGDVNINIDNSKDIRVNNNRNTVVRRNTYRPYTRPPYVYGGFHYRCYYPYYYHPYRPFYWGPVWHPWGFFIATLTATAIIVSFADADLPPVVHPGEYFVWQTAQALDLPNGMRSGPNMQDFGPLPSSPVPSNPLAGEEYYYDQGVFYLKGDGGYTVVAAPVGGIVKSIPDGYETIILDEKTGVKNYYWGGTFYEKVSKGYKVVPPTSGAVIEHLADGGEEVKLGDVTYVKLGETYYQPIQQNGKNVYEVVDVEEAK